MRHMTLAAASLGLVALAGCTGSTNPETAGLFDNIRNLNSGEYDRQIAQNRSQAQAILANNRAAEARIGQMERQRSANETQLAALRRQAADARAQANQARARVAGNPAQEQRVNALITQISAIEQDINSGTVEPASASRELNQITALIRTIN
jgi:chromosome segregation ATPase